MPNVELIRLLLVPVEEKKKEGLLPKSETQGASKMIHRWPLQIVSTRLSNLSYCVLAPQWNQDRTGFAAAVLLYRWKLWLISSNKKKLLFTGGAEQDPMSHHTDQAGG